MAKVARKLLQIAKVAKKLPRNLWLRLAPLKVWKDGNTVTRLLKISQMDRKPKFLSYWAEFERVELRYSFLWHLAAFNTLPSYCRLSLNEVY